MYKPGYRRCSKLKGIHIFFSAIFLSVYGDAGQNGYEKHVRTSQKGWCVFYCYHETTGLTIVKHDRRDHFKKDQEQRALIKQRTYVAVSQKNALFAKEHTADTNENLLQYVAAFAEELGKTPNACEIIGGSYISARFGGWEKVIAAAGLAPPGEVPVPEKRLIYKKEYIRQAKVLRRQKLEEKEQKREERRQKDAAGRVLVQEQLEKDRAWGAAHEADSDEQLLAYVKCTAEKLGHTPLSKEVPGATYIAKRVGSWALVLHLAGLPLPKGVKPPNPKTLKAYLQRKQVENQQSVNGKPYKTQGETT